MSIDLNDRDGLMAYAAMDEAVASVEDCADDSELHQEAAVAGLKGAIVPLMIVSLRRMQETPESLGFSKEELVNYLLVEVGSELRQAWDPKLSRFSIDMTTFATSVDACLSARHDEMQIVRGLTAHLPMDVQHSLRSRASQLMRSGIGAIGEMAKTVRELVASTIIG